MRKLLKFGYKKRAQFFIISAVALTMTFLTLNILFNQYFSVDSSSIYSGDEIYLFENMKQLIKDTSDEKCIESYKNIKELEFIFEEDMLRKGYFFDIQTILKHKIIYIDMELNSKNINLKDSFSVECK